MTEPNKTAPAGTTLGNLQEAHAAYENGAQPDNRVVSIFKRFLSWASEAHTRITKIEAFVNPLMQEGAALSGNAKIEALEQRVLALETTLNKIADGVQVGTLAAEGDTAAAGA